MLTLRLSVAGVEDAISVLYVPPVALLALTLGFRVGSSQASPRWGLLVAWVIHGDETLSALSWISRVAPLLLLGALAGIASDRTRESDRTQRYAMAVALLQREAAAINGSIFRAWRRPSGCSRRAKSNVASPRSSRPAFEQLRCERYAVVEMAVPFDRIEVVNRRTRSRSRW